MTCGHCHQAYPVLDGIPYLFKNPDAFFLQWAARFDLRKNQIAAHFARAQKTPEGSRLRKVSQAEQNNFETLKTLLPELLQTCSTQDSSPAASLSVLGSRIANTQHLESYWNTAFRDWSWGKDEVEASKSWILPVIESEWKNAAILGSGAGGLASQLAFGSPTTTWWAVDINPALLQIHRRMLLGESLLFFEIPLNPKDLNSVAPQQSLHSPGGNPSNLKLLVSDALNPCFKPKSLDAVLTSWFIDIVPEDFKALSRRMNTLLRMEGTWIIHGPQGFSNPFSPSAYTDEEICDLLREVGFEVISREQREQPYLHSPHDRQKRNEHVSLIVAQKKNNCQAPPAYVTDPDYLIDRELPIGPLAEFQELALDARTRAEILSAIDGKRSFNEVSKLMATHYRITESDAAVILTQLLTSRY